MTPQQFLARLAKPGPEPAYLFLGPEIYDRRRCRQALLEAVLPGPEEREEGLARHDLETTGLAAAIDDARALSLFAPRRVVWLSGAEALLPRGRAAETPDEAPDSRDAAVLAEYLKRPTPGVTLVVDAAKTGFEGEEKARLDRVARFYSAIGAVVEFRPYSPEAARTLAERLAAEAGLRIGPAEVALLLEATGAEAQRIAVEIDKLRLFAGGSRQVTAEDVAALVPDAQSASLFALVAALGRGDRRRALEIHDTLARAGEYMPLALAFLAAQFRMALAAREANLRGAAQIQAHLGKLGARIWPERARQIEQTVEAFPKARLERAMEKLFEGDRAFRDARPDDRLVMEELIVALTVGQAILSPAG